MSSGSDGASRSGFARSTDALPTASPIALAIVLAIVPASRELLRFDARGRAMFFAVQWLIVAVMICRMTCVEP